jgi:hypothetical protein
MQHMKNDRSNTTPTETTERPAPSLSSESKGSQKAKVILALSQPGKPLYNFWLSPTQEALQIATAEIAHSMALKGKSPRDIADVLAILGSANASALKQFVEKNLSLPSGMKAEAAAVDAAALIANLGL